VEFAKRQGKDRNLTDRWQEYYAARTELYSRNSLPFAVFAFVFLAVPLAIEIRPRAKSVAFLVAIVLIVVYYAIMAWSNAVGSGGSDLAWLAAMCPNLAIISIGGILFWRTQRIV
jgi:lipopolysaccharide export system permease protein